MSEGVGLGEEADELRKTEAEPPLGGGNSRLWQATGLALVFLDALGGAVFLPILPLLVRELGVGSDSSVAAWVGLLVGTYNAGRSGALAVARACASTRPANVFLHHALVVVGLSTAIYLVCGILVGRYGLWWFALFRLLCGMISAVHQTVGAGCLERASRQQEDAGSTVVRGKVPSTRESVVTIGGLMVGCVIAGFLFSRGDDRPIARLCLAVVGIHGVPALCALAICVQSGSLRRAGGWSAVAGFDLARPSFPGRWKKRSAGGSEIEMRIEGQIDGGADAEDRLAYNGPQRVVRPPSSPAPAQESRGGSPAESHTAPRFPQRYLRGCKGDPVEAQRRWQLTLEWRASERIDEVGVHRFEFLASWKFPRFWRRMTAAWRAGVAVATSSLKRSVPRSGASSPRVGAVITPSWDAGPYGSVRRAADERFSAELRLRSRATARSGNRRPA